MPFLNRINLCIAFLALLVGGALVPSGAICQERNYHETGVVITASPFWKPYSFEGADGELEGFLVQFWEKWSEKTGVPVTFQAAPWKDTIDLVIQGHADIQSGLLSTEERDKFFIYSSPIFHSSAVTVVAGNVTCDDGSSFLKWGGVAGTGEVEMVRKQYPDASWLLYENSHETIRALESGVIDAAVLDWSNVILVGRELELTICKTVYKRDLHGATLKGRPELLQLMNEGLAQISESERRFLVNRWFIGHESETDWSDSVTPVVVIILLSFGIWIWSFRRRG